MSKASAPSASADKVYEDVKEYYGKVLARTTDLKTTACCALERPHPSIARALKDVPDAILEKFYGWYVTFSCLASYLLMPMVVHAL